MKLDLFKTIEGLDENRLHPKFKLLRDMVQLVGEREVISNWTDGFLDRDNKIVFEFQTTFHSSFWEFYLFQVFKDAGFAIDFSKDRPDFIVTNPQQILIEAVVSNIKRDGRSEKDRNIEDIMSMIVPPHKQSDFFTVLDEAIVRNSNAIDSKSKKFLEKYINCEWVKSEHPFVIALSSYGQINYGREHFYPMMALLYGAYFNPSTDSYDRKESLLKPGTDSTLSLNIFKNESFAHISAIIFSCTVTLGKLTSLSISEGPSVAQLNGVINIRHDFEPPHYKIQVVSEDTPEYLTDGLYIFHNPNALNPLDINLFKRTNAIQVYLKDGLINFVGENTPIYSRINILKHMITEDFLKLVALDFNG